MSLAPRRRSWGTGRTRKGRGWRWGLARRRKASWFMVIREGTPGEKDYRIGVHSKNGTLPSSTYQFSTTFDRFWLIMSGRTIRNASRQKFKPYMINVPYTMERNRGRNSTAKRRKNPRSTNWRPKRRINGKAPTCLVPWVARPWVHSKQAKANYWTPPGNPRNTAELRSSTWMRQCPRTRTMTIWWLSHTLDCSIGIARSRVIVYLLCDWLIKFWVTDMLYHQKILRNPCWTYQSMPINPYPHLIFYPAPHCIYYCHCRVWATPHSPCLRAPS